MGADLAVVADGQLQQQVQHTEMGFCSVMISISRFLIFIDDEMIMLLKLIH